MGRTKKVLKTVLELLPAQPSLRKVTIDFEKALWTVLRELLPTVEIHGCVFHRLYGERLERYRQIRKT